MKIRYEFANGEVSEVEVSEELGRALADMTHCAALRDRAETRRHVSLDRLIALGAQIIEDQPSVEALAEQALDIAALHRATEQLTPKQRDLLRMVYEEGRSCASIAREDGVSEFAVRDRLYRIHKKLKNYL